MPEFEVATIAHRDLAMTNKVYFHPDDLRALAGPSAAQAYIQYKQWVFTVVATPQVIKGTVGFNAVQRGFADLAVRDKISISIFRPEEHKDIFLSSLELEVNFLKKSTATPTFDCAKMEELIKREFDQQIFCVDQRFVLDIQGHVLLFRGVNICSVDLASLKDGVAANNASARGVLTKKTQITFLKAGGATFRLTGAKAAGRNQIFKPDWNFENMGIGGLDNEFTQIFRRAFASRIFPTSVTSRLGINHVKGMLLYGPPGTGKTLLARKIGKMLNGKEPKIVNGPEILNKYVGQSEENIRKLFEDAEKEYAERGDESDLHIIIFDEIDAICKTRGSVSSGTGVHDTVVNQLLTKIDGVNSLNNILVIGMTNRKDMIDEALLRPGRLEVHVEIGLPDENGRLQIFRIHTAKLASNLAPDVDLLELAAVTKNYTGAEIEGVVRAASSFAFLRCVDIHDPTHAQNPDSIQFTRADFMAALEEVPPKFGVSSNDFAGYDPGNMISFGLSTERLMNTCGLFIQQVKHSSPLVTMLLEGSIGAGKTTVAASLALKGEFPFIKLISPDSCIGFSETHKAQYINDVFEDAYKSALSCVVIDDVERLLEYVPIGPRFSNVVLQTLLVLFKKLPPKGRRLMIIGTTSSRQVLADMGLVDIAMATLNVPCVNPGNEVEEVLKSMEFFSPADIAKIAKYCVQPVPVKKLINITEMVRQGPQDNVAARFIQCMKDYGYDSNGFL